jgi:outer membrane protein assembly factor BamD
MSKRIVVFILLAGMMVSCSKFSRVLKSNDYDYKLKMADAYYAKKKYNLATQLYEELFPLYKGTQKFEDLYYKYTYCYYYQKDYLNAENLFKEFLSVFPNSSKREEMEYMRAFSYYKLSPKVPLDQTNTTRAIGLMQSFINNNLNSARVKEANEIIDKCRAKLEQKDASNAELYYNIGQYRAAGIAYAGLLNNYPESGRSDEYKFMVIKSYYLFALNSIEEKKIERFEQVINEYNDFTDRFQESKYKPEADRYYNITLNNIKVLQNEQNKTTTQR